VAAGVGGGFAFIGGFLALMGSMADRHGLTVGGAITAGIGLAAIAPGVWLITSSGSKVEILSEGAPIPTMAAAPGLGLRGSF
jgi:hypothetical protein